MSEKQMKEQFRTWLATRYVPIFGADDDDNTDDASGSTGDDNAGDAEASADADADADADGEGAGTDDGDGDDGSAASTQQAQLSDLHTKLKAAEQAAVRAKKEAADARAERAQETGNWQQLAQQRESELQDVNEKIVKAEEERNQAATNLADFQRRHRVNEIATRLSYKDPGDAVALLQAQEARLREEGKVMDLMADDSTTERALKKLAESKKYLVDQKRRTGAPMNGNSGGTSLTEQQIKEMSQDEVTARLPEINKFLEAQAAGKT